MTDDEDLAELDRLLAASSFGDDSPRRLRDRVPLQDVHLALERGNAELAEPTTPGPSSRKFRFPKLGLSRRHRRTVFTASAGFTDERQAADQLITITPPTPAAAAKPHTPRVRRLSPVITSVLVALVATALTFTIRVDNPPVSVSSGSPWPLGPNVQIGVMDDHPGVAFKQDGLFSGFDIDIATMAANALGKQPHFAPVAPDERRTALKNGRVHLLVATYSITPERMADGIDFVGPYAISPSAFLLRRGSPELRKVSDLAGKRVCTVTGSNSTPLEHTNAVFVRANSIGQCVQQVRVGQSDAAFYGALPLYGFAQQDPTLVVQGESLRLIDNEYYGIALPQGHRKECDQMRAALKNYIAGGIWVDDFSSALGWSTEKANQYKPTGDQIDAYSCRRPSS
jgi:glutamate transport system substrate-binding protein